jgi:indolepyruvate ferredoxin oxidoreductase alpha subunit
MEMAFGASVGGRRALLCVKGVGLNVALDPLMALNLSGCNAGFVILVGDDPGGWGSQNEQDSRALALAAELPLLEPTTVSDAGLAMRQAFQWSEAMGMPVLVRITRALVMAEGCPRGRGLRAVEKTGATGKNRATEKTAPPAFVREFMRWVVLPINVVPYHRRLLRKLDEMAQDFEESALNSVQGGGVQGVIAAGFTYQKLCEVLAEVSPPLRAELRILRLGTFNPMPPALITTFLEEVSAVLVLEETAPWVERAMRDMAQQEGLTVPIYGRDTHHVPRVGELLLPHIADSLNRFMPRLALSTEGARERPRPSRQPLCDACPYIPTFDALLDVMQQAGGRETFIVVGDPGCMVRAQLPPYKLLDVKNSLGSSVGMAAGLALSQQDADPGKRVIALCGDSSFLHSGLGGLVDAARFGARMLVVILDNGITALSGGQAHPASAVNARGIAQLTVDVAALARDAGAGLVEVVDLDQGEDVHAALARGVDFEGVAVLIARGQCIKWSG